MNRLLDAVRGLFDRRTDAGRIAQNSGWLIADKVLRGLLGLPIAVLLPRYLGIEQFGVLSYAYAWLAILTAAAGLGLDNIIVRELVRHPAKVREILASAFTIKLAAGFCITVIAIGTTFYTSGSSEVSSYLVSILAGTLLFQAMDATDYWFQSQVESRYAVVARLLGFVGGIAVKISLIATKAPLAAFAWAQLAESTLVAYLLYSIYYRRTSTSFPLFSLDRPLAAKMLRDATPLFFSALAVVLYMRIDVLMLERMSTPEEVGIYSAAAKLSEIWYAIPMAWVASASPSILRLHGTDPAQFHWQMARLYRGLFWVGLVISLLTTALAQPIVTLLYGQAFIAAAPVLAIHIWASIPGFLGVASSRYLLAENLQSVSLLRTATGLLANVLLNLFLIPRYGAIGAAIATAISYTVVTLAMGLSSRARQHTGQMLRALVLPIARANSDRKA